LLYAQPGAATPSDNYRDAYVGAREDLLDWKRRALEAERKLDHVISEMNGPVKFGDPFIPAAHSVAVPAVPDVPREVHLGKGEFVIWPVKIDGIHGLAFVSTSNPMPVGTNHHATAEGELELGRDDTVILFGNVESTDVLAERLQHARALLQSSPHPNNGGAK